LISSCMYCAEKLWGTVLTDFHFFNCLLFV
jgi:hypothetical protein